MNNDDAERAHPRHREAPAQSVKMQLALLNMLEAIEGWDQPLVTAHALATVFQSVVVGTMKLDRRHIPWVLALVEQVNTHVAECVAALTSNDTKN
jgi:hypothetical protein